MVGQCHVVAPNVKLPFPQAQHAAQYVSGVYADPHVHVKSCRFSDESLHTDIRTETKLLPKECDRIIANRVLLRSRKKKINKYHKQDKTRKLQILKHRAVCPIEPQHDILNIILILLFVIQT